VVERSKKKGLTEGRRASLSRGSTNATASVRNVEKPVLIGYFPKKTVRLPEWLKAAHIEEVCSVSECVSAGPADWIDAWKHNEHWVFNSPSAAASVIPEGHDGFDIYAFKQYPARIVDGVVEDEEVCAPDVVGLTDDFEFLGFDAVSRSCGNAFECSPLSCNHGAESIPCNPKCLFDSLEEAIEGAKGFSSGTWEPGPYYVVEVHRQGRGE
jgi:hypothetical protein